MEVWMDNRDEYFHLKLIVQIFLCINIFMDILSICSVILCSVIYVMCVPNDVLLWTVLLVFSETAEYIFELRFTEGVSEIFCSHLKLISDFLLLFLISRIYYVNFVLETWMYGIASGEFR